MLKWQWRYDEPYMFTMVLDDMSQRQVRGGVQEVGAEVRQRVSPVGRGGMPIQHGLPHGQVYMRECHGRRQVAEAMPLRRFARITYGEQLGVVHRRHAAARCRQT